MVGVRCLLLARNRRDGERLARPLLGLKLPRFDEVAGQFMTHSGHRGVCQFALQQLVWRLLYHLVGGHEQCVWYCEAECLRGLEIDHELEFGGLHDR
jgi:hypothetical protein